MVNGLVFSLGGALRSLWRNLWSKSHKTLGAVVLKLVELLVSREKADEVAAGLLNTAVPA